MSPSSTLAKGPGWMERRRTPLLLQLVHKMKMLLLLQSVPGMRMLLRHHPCDGNVFSHFAALGGAATGPYDFRALAQPGPPVKHSTFGRTLPSPLVKWHPKLMWAPFCLQVLPNNSARLLLWGRMYLVETDKIGV